MNAQRTAETRPATPSEMRRILEGLGISLPRRHYVVTRDQAIAAYVDIGRPVAVKFDSLTVAHKSELGGVALHLDNERELTEAFNRLDQVRTASLPEVEIVVEEMVEPGVEIILATRRDELFGPVLMLGLGGVLVELLEDVAFRLIPASNEDVIDMLGELKLRQLLNGYRSLPVVDIDALCDIAVKASSLFSESTAIQEIEINPMIARGNVFTAVDCRVLLTTW